MDRVRYDLYHDDWKRSDFSDHYSTYRKNNHRGTISLTDLTSHYADKKTKDNLGQSGYLPYGTTNASYDFVDKRRPSHGYRIGDKQRRSAESESSEGVKESDDTDPNRSLASIMSRFAERTSCVGPPYINSSNHFYSKFFWSVVFVAMLTATAVNVYLNVAAYRSFAVKTTLSIGYSALTFPMVTVCNTNPLRNSTRHLASQELQDFLSLLNPKKFERPLPTTPHSGRKRRFVDNYQRQQSIGNKTFGKHQDKIGDGFGGDIDPLFKTAEEFNFLIGEQDSETRFNMSHQIDEMLMSCSFEGRACHVDNFTRFLTSDYGACYSFNHVTIGNGNSPLFQSYRSGNKYGVQLMLFLQTDEYIPGLTLGYGLRVSVSYPKAMPFPDSDGLFVTSGTETDIGIRMINITRKSLPYGVCESSAKFTKQFGFEYSRQACQSVCPHRFILSQCECYDPSSLRLYPLNTSQSYPPCESTQDYGCIADILYANTINGSLRCNCPNPCTESTYDIFLSGRQWPEDNYMHALIDKVCRTAGQEHMCDNLLLASPEEQRRNFVKVNVFYRDLNFEELTEEADYPESQFLSDLGGSIGLWVGLSIISLIEVLELVLQICVWLGRRLKQCTRRSRRRSNSQKQRDKSKEYVEPPIQRKTPTTAGRMRFSEGQLDYPTSPGQTLW